MFEKQSYDMFLCWLPHNSAAHSAFLWHGLQELHFYWPWRGYIMTLKDLHLYGGNSYTLFSFQANQTWAFSGLGDNSIINPKLRDIVECTGYYLRLSFVQAELTRKKKEIHAVLEFRQMKATGAAAFKTIMGTLWWCERCLKLWPA